MKQDARTERRRGSTRQERGARRHKNGQSLNLDSQRKSKHGKFVSGRSVAYQYLAFLEAKEQRDRNQMALRNGEVLVAQVITFYAILESVERISMTARLGWL